MATGTCFACAYAPVAFNASTCPRCGAREPNPGIGNRFAGRGTLLGFAGGALVGGALGYVAAGVAGAVGGALLGALAGLVLGLFLGLTAALVAWLSGRR
jgi:hypothetical protein